MSSLTIEQKEVIELIQQKITLTSKGNIFQLDGPGGVGKTFIIKYLVDYYKQDVHICAPTNKACKILRDKLDSKTLKVTTCHQYFNATSHWSGDGKQYWKFRRPAKKVKVIIIDEVSMVDKILYEQFLKLLQSGVNIITMGDNCQLPPIDNLFGNSSKVSKETPFYTEHKIDYTLTKNIRNTNPEYNQLLEKIRYLIKNFNSNETKDHQDIVSIINLLKQCLKVQKIQFTKQEVNNVSDDIWNMYTEKHKLIKSNENLKDILKVCMLAYRTGKQNTVYELNQKIREHIFPNSKERFNPQEKIIFTGFYKKKIGIFLDNEEDFFITYYTSDEDIINKVSMGRMKFYDEIFNVYRLYLDSMEKMKTLKDVKFDNKLYVTTLHESEFKRFNIYEKKVKEQIKFKVKEEKDKCSISCKIDKSRGYKECEHDIIINDLWDEYNICINSIKCPIDYSYAMSIHKSQGSSFDQVFIYLSDFIWLFHSNNPQENKILFLKLLYVALSRSKSTSIIF